MALAAAARSVLCQELAGDTFPIQTSHSVDKISILQSMFCKNYTHKKHNNPHVAPGIKCSKSVAFDQSSVWECYTVFGLFTTYLSIKKKNARR